MRPIRLTLRGINSYRKEQTIDFAALTSAGLFGIFGPTGSGKSSILDAMILALYAKLPRSTKNFININENTAAVSFLFSITTTETLFYQVERSFRYHKNGSSVTVRNTAASLTKRTGEQTVVLADRPVEVTQECTRLLGLTSDDFMRTVVLPQGQFSEFLKLKNADRRNMLQRIFHLEEYGLELTQKIASARQRQDLLLSRLEGQLQVYDAVSQEILDALRQQHQDAVKQKKETEEQKILAEKAFQEADAARSILEEYNTLKKQWENCQEKQPAMQEKEQKLALARQAEQIRPFAQRAQTAAEAYTQAEQRRKQLRSDLETLLNTHQLLLSRREAASRKYEETLPVLLRQDETLRSAMEGSRIILDRNQKKDAAVKALQTGQKDLQKISAQNETLKKQEDDIRRFILQMENSAVQLRPSREFLQALEQGRLLEESYREKKKRYEDDRQTEQKLHAQLETERIHQDTLTGQILKLTQQTELELSLLKKNLEKITAELLLRSGQKETVEKEIDQLKEQHMALILRGRLRDGDVCPVCGSVHHISCSDDPASSTAMQNEKTAETAEEDQGVILRLKDLQKKRESLHTQTEQLTIRQKELEQQLAASDINRQTLTGLAAEISDGSSTPVADSGLSRHPSENMPANLPDPQLLSSQYITCRERRNHLEEQYKKLHEDNAARYQTLQQAAREIMDLRTSCGVENFTTALDDERKKEQQYDRIQEQIQQHRQKIDQIREQRAKLSEESSSLSSRTAALINDIEHYTSDIKEETRKLPEGCTPDMDYAALLQESEQQRRTLETTKKDLDKQFETSDLQIREKQKQTSAAEEQTKLCLKNQEEAVQTLQEQLSLAGFSTDTDLSRLYLTTEEMRLEEKALNDFKEAYSSIKERMQYLEEKQIDPGISGEEWEKRRRQLNLLTEEYDTIQKQEAILSKDQDAMQVQLAEKTKLEQQLKEERHRRGLIRQLEQLFKGNAFIEYVSESRLRYIAREASVILDAISNGNYALEINDSAEFVIRDNKNGGILRPCDTLSGGETFITSLSLALALSSSIQLNGAAPLELFFLDEGFGNLDDELLDVVMTSLERLQSKKRSIGVITHVEAIQARVPVKLIVTPSDISQNGSSIRMEYS